MSSFWSSKSINERKKERKIGGAFKSWSELKDKWVMTDLFYICSNLQGWIYYNEQNYIVSEVKESKDDCI
jgi:hypothetical protein